MDDFLYALKLELEDKVTEDQMIEQLNLYREYIMTEMNNGKSLEQVLRKLGDPALIAKLIVESYEKREKQERHKDNWDMMASMTAEEINAKIKNPEHGIRAEFIPDKGWDVRLGKLKLNSWYGTLIILGVVLAAFVLLSTIFPGLRMEG